VAGPLGRDAYYAALAGCDLVLLPYGRAFVGRTSGVFCEATALAKPAVVTAGTWMAEQVEGGNAAGVVARREIEALVSAVAEATAALPALSAEARRLAHVWRRTQSMPAFLDRVFAELAAAGVGLVTR
jgi:glycosyltransferase involved in cell wall biosynthesis